MVRMLRHLKEDTPPGNSVRSGPEPLLHSAEPLLVTMILDCANYGAVFSAMELRLLMATMIENEAIGPKCAAWAAKSRGESGEIAVKPADSIPGPTRLKSFLRRHETNIKTGYPKS